MARLTNVNTGVVVNVPDAKAGRLNSDWVSADAEPKRGPGRPKKADEKSDEK